MQQRLELFSLSSQILPPSDTSVTASSLCPACSCAVASAAGIVPPPAGGVVPRRGLKRLLTDPEVDELFRIRSELDSQAFGTADAELLLPFLRAIHGEHNRLRGPGPQTVGGFVDVGANIGDVTEQILGIFTDHGRRFYMHHLAPPGDPRPPLVDAVHPTYEGGKVAFVYALEPSPPTRELLMRRAEAGLWSKSNVRIIPVAATNSTGTATFCSYNSGSGQSSLAGSEQGGILAAGKEQQLLGEKACEVVKTMRLADVLEQEDLTKKLVARVFLLKIDVEGAEAVVLAGAEPLFAKKRVSYVVFENHAKWAATQADLGVTETITVGDVVTKFAGFGYRCHYVSPWGLIPFEHRGTETGDAVRPGCNEGLPFCARHRLYNRQFWSNVLCAASPEEDASVEWLSDVLVNPSANRETLLCGEAVKSVCSSLL